MDANEWLEFAELLDAKADIMGSTTVWVGAANELRKASSSIRWQVRWEEYHGGQ